MKTLSKYPGIFLLEKGEAKYVEVQHIENDQLHKYKLVPLSELTEEQLFNLVGVGMKEYWESDIEDHREFLYSHIKKLNGKDFDPADILIEIPQNNIINLSHKHRKK